jgi:hypothetical protein
MRPGEGRWRHRGWAVGGAVGSASRRRVAAARRVSSDRHGGQEEVPGRGQWSPRIARLLSPPLSSSCSLWPPQSLVSPGNFWALEVERKVVLWVEPGEGARGVALGRRCGANGGVGAATGDSGWRSWWRRGLGRCWPHQLMDYTNSASRSWSTSSSPRPSSILPLLYLAPPPCRILLPRGFLPSVQSTRWRPSFSYFHLIILIYLIFYFASSFALRAICWLILLCLLALVLWLEAGGEVHGAPISGEEILESLSL